MIIRDRSDRVVEFEIVFKGRIVSSPTNYIIRTELTFSFENFPNVFIEDNPIFLFVLIPSSWELKVSRVSQTIGSYRSKFWKPEMMSEYLSYPPFYFPCDVN